MALTSQQPMNDLESSIAAHNNARLQKGCGPLQWHDGLAHDAEVYAHKLAGMNMLQHAHTQGQGENLYMSTSDASFEQAVHAWLDEGTKYQGESIAEGNFSDWGHYSKPAFRSCVLPCILTIADSSVPLARDHSRRHGQGQSPERLYLHRGQILAAGQYGGREALLIQTTRFKYQSGSTACMSIRV